jgi:hypothetical protein
MMCNLVKAKFTDQHYSNQDAVSRGDTTKSTCRQQQFAAMLADT